MAKEKYKTIREYVTEKIELTILALVMVAIAAYFFPEIRIAAYVALGLVLVYFIFQLLFNAGFVIEVPEYKRAVVFRMGHFHRVAGPGWVILIPFLESVEVLDLRVQSFDLPPQEVITTDEIRTAIDTIVYYQILDPKKAVLKVREFEKTATGFVYGALRDIASDLTLNELFGELEKVNDLVKVKMEPLVSEWGTTIIDVQITNVTIPENIQMAMHARRRAKEEWAAAQYQARAQKTMIESLGDAAKKLDQNALNYMYIKEGLPRIAEGKSTKLFFPTQFTDLAKAFSNNQNPNPSALGAAAAAIYPVGLRAVGAGMTGENEGEPDITADSGETAEGKAPEEGKST